MDASPTPVLDHRVGVGVSQPGGRGTPAVVGLLDGDRMFWPEMEISFAPDGHNEMATSDAEPQDWNIFVEAWEAMAE